MSSEGLPYGDRDRRRVWAVDGMIKAALGSASPRGLNIFAAIMAGFAGLIMVGLLLLMLPLSSTTGSWTKPLTALFTAASPVTDTGLVVVETGTHWSRFGQVTILALIRLRYPLFSTSSIL